MGQRKYKRKFKVSNGEVTSVNVRVLPSKKTGTISTRVDTKHSWIYAVILVAVTFAVFYPSLSLGFVNWDDQVNILENKTLEPFTYEWSWGAVKSIFTTHVIGGYNPLSIFTFAVEKYFFAPYPTSAPFIFHFNNLWMHLVCTLLVFLIFLQFSIEQI
jgi:hypothetical protein